MVQTVLAQEGGGGISSLISLAIFAAIFIGSMILRARAEAKARERRLRASQGEEGPEPVPPEVREVMRRIGLEPVPPQPPPTPGVPPGPDEATILLTRADIVAPGTSRPKRAAKARRVRPRAEPVTVRQAPPGTPSARWERALMAPVRTPEPGAAGPTIPLVQLRRTLQEDLAGGPPSLRKAILLAEILGPPRAVRPLEDRLGAPPGGV